MFILFRSLGISYPSDLQLSLESRRTTHKAAEQKRRDSLKQSFDDLKKVVPYTSSLGNGTKADPANGKGQDASSKNVSKLFLLKKGENREIEQILDFKIHCGCNKVHATYN